MTPELRTRMLDTVHRRAAMLARQTAPGHPAREVVVLLASSAHSLFCALVIVLGDRFLQEWLTSMFGALNKAQGICPFCRTHPLRPDRTMCQPCWDDVDAEDREVARQVQLHEVPPVGRIS